MKEDEKMNKYYVFVYGTLRRDECNHFLLKNATLIAGECWTEGNLYDPDCGYPFFVRSDNGRVYGELYQVNDLELQSLDELEDYDGPGKNNLYDRIVQTIFTDLGSYEAYVYVLPEGKTVENMVLIENGDWCVYRHLSDHHLN